MKKYILRVAYDGTDYYGWQEQPQKRTVATTLKYAFRQSFALPVTLHGASRTDAGVHALGQVVLATTELDLDLQTLKRAWNSRLPRDVSIRDVIYAPDSFHPRFDARLKTYQYHFFTSRPLPMFARYGAVYYTPFDEQKLRDALQVFVGKHDFRSFCSNDEPISTIRHIESIHVTYIKQWRAYRITFCGRSFLQYMIRRIVGAALDCAMKKEKSPHDLARILAECNQRQVLPKAPAEGLVLRKILYPSIDWNLQ